MDIYTTNAYIRDTFGEKLYKISLNAGTTCPNRDGKAGTGGCIFCSASGSGDFSEDAVMSIDEQIELAKKRISGKCKCDRYIAYFQSYTNTYGDVDVLREKFLAAARRDDIAAVSIASRPDCFDPEVIDMIKDIIAVKPVWIELGLQTANDRTAQLINRCYDISVYDETMNRLRELGVHIIVHMIIGLPGETKEDMLDTVRYIVRSGANGIKLQLLHVLRGTVLEKMYEEGVFRALTFAEYADILCDCLKELPPDMVVHRFTGDGPKNILVAPLWSADKKRVINDLNRIISKL
ncbi:TIGR01212 family radical SAM protein [Coprococcus aceti]|uniref:TIGR01212 family radical SAM protein n=1 Tax=Coprococcus aceti TaxID=2981786 RepID=UPI0022E4E678|nr:TIGR01212 family radical SAM protein [Coprococcus aceti]